jgi:hypothetical protein
MTERRGNGFALCSSQRGTGRGGRGKNKGEMRCCNLGLECPPKAHVLKGLVPSSLCYWEVIEPLGDGA